MLGLQQWRWPLDLYLQERFPEVCRSCLMQLGRRPTSTSVTHVMCHSIQRFSLNRSVAIIAHKCCGCLYVTFLHSSWQLHCHCGRTCILYVENYRYQLLKAVYHSQNCNYFIMLLFDVYYGCSSQVWNMYSMYHLNSMNCRVNHYIKLCLCLNTEGSIIRTLTPECSIPYHCIHSSSYPPSLLLHLFTVITCHHHCLLAYYNNPHCLHHSLIIILSVSLPFSPSTLIP